MINHKHNLLVFLLATMPQLAHAEQQVTNLFDLSLTELQHVEVTTAGKTEQKIKDIPASVQIISRRQIEDYGYTSLTEVLEHVPGMYNINSYNGAPGNFGLRGFWNPFSQNSNIAIMVNGVKQLNDDTYSNPMAKINVPVEAIDRIEIIKGPMSVIYGSGASFGVINIITNDIEDEVSLASVTAGSRNSKKLVGRISESADDSYIVVNAAGYSTDGQDNRYTDMISPANQSFLPFAGISDPDYSTGGRLEHQSQYLGLSGGYKRLYFDASLNVTDKDIYALVPSLRDGIERHSESYTARIGYRDEITSWMSLDSYLDVERHYDDDLLDIFDPDSYGIRAVNYTAYEFEINSVIRPNDQWNIIIGINNNSVTDHLERYDIPAAQVDPFNQQISANQSFSRHSPSTLAFFTQATWSPHDSLTLVAGVRHEVNQAYSYDLVEDIGEPTQTGYSMDVDKNSNTLPRLAAIYHFDDKNTLKLLYGEASRIVPDDSGDTENTSTYEINYIHTSNRSHLSASLFYNELENLFQQDLVTDANGTFDFVLTRGEGMKTHGIELLSHHKLTDSLLAELAYTWQQTELDSTGMDAAYSPESVAHIKGSYLQGKNRYATTIRYVSEIKPEFAVGETVSDYAVVDLNYRRDDTIAGAYINVRLTNLFDEQVRYPNNVQFNELLDRGTIGYGRSIFGTLGWKF